MKLSLTNWERKAILRALLGETITLNSAEINALNILKINLYDLVEEEVHDSV